VLCIVMLPAWLVLAGKPLMLVIRHDRSSETDRE
jgi:hypothetical protein